MLTILNALPDGLLDVTAAGLRDVLPGPTLLELPGARPEPLFVSILLHGNEDVGLLAIQRVLRSIPIARLPRSLSVFVGNVDAARRNVRRLPGQPDYNRIWPGADDADTPEARMMASIVDRLRSRNVFASIDLHNNTGHNPHYTCLTHLDDHHLQLAALFGPTAVFFRRPRGVQTGAMGNLCPAVTCECGKVGDEAGVEHAASFVQSSLHLSHIPSRPVPEGDLHLFHTVATIRVPPGVDFDFEPEAADLVFRADLDRLNFAEVAPSTCIARRRPSTPTLLVEDENGDDVSHVYLDQIGEAVHLRRPAMPSMFTKNRDVIRQDCLGYLMERFPLPRRLCTLG